MCYRLIKFIIKEYRANELYTSQWLEIFIHQSIFNDPNIDIMSEPTLTELIDNNKVKIIKIFIRIIFFF